MHNIHAYTQLNSQPYPGYVSINETVEGMGDFTLTVRQPSLGGTKQATLPMTREQLLTMANDILAKLGHRQAEVSRG